MDSWKLKFDKWEPEKQGFREALLTFGNGYFASRGAFEESRESEIHYPGTYLAGGYNRLKTDISGTVVENESMVNWPNWLYLTFRIEGEQWLNLNDLTIIDFQIELNLKEGLHTRRIIVEDAKDRQTKLVSKRFVSMDNEHVACIRWNLEPLNWSGKIEIVSGIDGKVRNNNVNRYKPLNKHHLKLKDKGPVKDLGIFLKVKSNQSSIEMTQACRTKIYRNKEPIRPREELIDDKAFLAQNFTFKCEEKEQIEVEKVVSLFTSKDLAISESSLEAKNEIEIAGNFDELFSKHKKAWKRLWEKFDIEISSSDNEQMVLRFHIFHLLQTVSFNSFDLDVGIPSRGLHGEAYHGHVFWDELFIFPFLNLRIPEMTRELLLYRYRRLKEARKNAEKVGHQGACFPWRSGSNGREETPKLQFNTLNNKWYPDNTHLQRHINAAIVYNIWQYYEASGDKEFMFFHGGRLILEICKFFSSLTSFNEERQRFEIKGVVGPDEYHTTYPGNEKPGLNNNAYTNVMASWVLQKGVELKNILTESRCRELFSLMGLNEQDLEKWKVTSSKMFIPFINETLICQFEGFEKLKELDWQKYTSKYEKYLRLDLILNSEGDNVNNYKAVKQADVLMLFYIFSLEELKQLFGHMGYPFSQQTILDSINYYEQRNSHASSLCRVVYSWVLARSYRPGSWVYFKDALNSDIEDIQGGTTREGIHLGAMAGTVDMVQRGYTGMEVRHDVLWFNPRLPSKMKSIKMRLNYRGYWFKLILSHHKMEIDFEEKIKGNIKIGFKGKVYSSENKKHLSFEY